MKKTMKEIWNSQAMKKFIHNKKAMLGLAIVTILVLAVVFIPLFTDLDPYTTDRAAGFNKPPSDAHILGTDDVGRDLFARLLYGGRISLFVGITSTIISVLIGIPLGLIAGYFRGTDRKSAENSRPVGICQCFGKGLGYSLQARPVLSGTAAAAVHCKSGSG